MKNKLPEGEGAARHRRRSNVAIKESLRDLRVQLSLLNHRVGGRLDLKDVDLDCLDLIARHGPLSPSALARRAGLHPATLTGILDRLERGGWVARDRDPSDRRAILVRALRDRNPELLSLYSGMNASMDQICARYGETELKLIADFLRRTATAGRRATDELAGDQVRRFTMDGKHTGGQVEGIRRVQDVLEDDPKVVTVYAHGTTGYRFDPVEPSLTVGALSSEEHRRTRD